MYYSCLLLFLPFAFSQISGKEKSITTHLNAAWPNAPLLIEISEYLAEENSITFWAFTELINALDLKEFSKRNDREKYDIALEHASRFLSASQINLLKFSLSLHVHFPKIEAFRQIALDNYALSIEKCRAFVDIGGKSTCDVNELKKLIHLTDPIMQNEDEKVFVIDHQYPGGERGKVLAVLYGELGTEEFRVLHDALKLHVGHGDVRYIFRPFVKNPTEQKVRLSGYGVELQIKSTEYKAQDDTKVKEDGGGGDEADETDQELDGFIFKKLKQLHPESEEQLTQFRRHLIDNSHEMAPLKVWQLQHLSMQAANKIMTAPKEEMLSIFTQTAQNFPAIARSLTTNEVDQKMKKEILKNQKKIQSNTDFGPNDAALFINGMHFDLDYVDIYTLLDNIKNEQRVMEGLFRLGIHGDKLSNLLSLDLSESNQEYGIDIRDSAIAWMNNIETDKAYSRWPSSTSELLRPAYPGMLRSIRKNFHNMVLIVDPAQDASIKLLQMVDSFMSHTTPLRFGIVFAINSDKKITGKDDIGVAILCAFNYVVQSFDEREDANVKGLKFLIDLYSANKGEISVSDVHSFFKGRFKSEDLDDVFGDDSDFDVGRQLSKMFVEKGSFENFPRALFNGIPTLDKQLSGDEFEELMLMEVMKNTQILQREVYRGGLDDTWDVMDWLMAKPNIMPRLNDRILTTKTSTFLDMSGISTESISSAFTSEDFKQLGVQEMTTVIGNSCRYLATKAEHALRLLTVWVVGDFDTDHGRKLLLEAVKYTRESNGVRICPLFNGEQPGVLSRAVQVAFSSLAPGVSRQFLGKILDDDNARQIINMKKKPIDFAPANFDAKAFESRYNTLKSDIFEAQSDYSQKVLNILPHRSTVVANGRILGTFANNETFSGEDFGLMERFFAASLGDKVAEVLKGESETVVNDLICKVSAILQTKPQSKSRVELPEMLNAHSVVKMDARDDSQPIFDLLAICDPVSLAAQKIGPLLQVLYKVLNANIRLVLNAVEKHSEMPLKSFYRYVLESEPQFTASGNCALGPSARFYSIPESLILTQNYHVPENWLVEVVKSAHDLDNIKMEQVESGVHSEFELEHLLLEGHCFEQSTGNPPRGLQFTLGSRTNPRIFDTIVMANLGYFQLKANPGGMVLNLREGRSNDIYDIYSHEGSAFPDSRSSKNVVFLLSSFRSNVVKIRVSKKPEMEDLDLLSDNEEPGGLWNSITSTFSSSKEEKEVDEYINIFSVASGHLYERFLRIMMVSVRKHTKLPVKFWIIKDFLSPLVKDSLPILAKEFDFEYELVQYKWPRWLHQQTEKQRIIWGYKILFLDVLFPLDVKKIIFIDADQIVRTDLDELRSVDLEGAPYGFVPFCDSRKEMEGFRFWKQGYWRNHLAHRKYHISALFVVDLKKFRLIAAGDRLRGQYQGLSQDPNSLSNLDQDLPNNMIHQVKIKSLPQDWLWCETWCDDASKETAKVIDLCNNPLTKEAKLVAANRIISEWSDYDNAIKDALSRQDLPSTMGKQHTDSHSHIEL